MDDVNIWYFHSIKKRTDCKQDMNSRSWMLLSLQQRSISLNWCARWRAFSILFFYLGASLWKLAELRPASLQKSEKVSKKNKYMLEASVMLTHRQQSRSPCFLHKIQPWIIVTTLHTNRPVFACRLCPQNTSSSHFGWLLLLRLWIGFHNPVENVRKCSPVSIWI